MGDILSSFAGGLQGAPDGQRSERMCKFTESYKKQFQHRGWDCAWGAIPVGIWEMGRVAQSIVALLYLSGVHWS